MTSRVLTRWAFAIIAVFLIYITLIVTIGTFDNVPDLPDTVSHVAIASRHELSDPSLFSHGLYPGGYLALLRLLVNGFHLFPVLPAKLLSATCGFVSLLACARIAWCLGGFRTMLITCWIALTNRTILCSSVTEGTDSPAASLQLLAVAVALGKGQGDRVGAWRALASGALLGIGYLFRFPALALAPVILLWVAGNGRRRVLSISSFVLGFSLAAAPQLLCSALLRDNPLYNEQAKNVWFGIYGNQDWAGTWHMIPKDVTLLNIVSTDPARFALHWIDEISAFFSARTGWCGPFEIPVLVAAAVFILTRTLPLLTRLFLVGVVLLPVIASSMAFMLPRHGLVSVHGIAVLAGVTFEHFVRELHRCRNNFRTWLGVGAVIGMATLAYSWRNPCIENRPPDEWTDSVHKAMSTLGVDSYPRVWSETVVLQPDSPWPMGFCTARALGSIGTAGSLVASFSPFQDIQFVAIGGHNSNADLSDVVEDAGRGGTALVPLWLDGSLKVYMVRPKGLGGVIPQDVFFDSGISLLGYTWIWRTNNVALYLFWTASREITENVTIRVRMIDEDGLEICSHSGKPELGTYPTTAWIQGVLVVDMHLLEPPNVVQSAEPFQIMVECQGLNRSERFSLCTVFPDSSSPLP